MSSLSNLQVLIIDDNPDHQEILEYNLNKIPDFHAQITKTLNLAEGLKAFKEKQFDLVFLDMNLPDSSVDQTVPKFLEKRSHSVPIIVMSSLHQNIMLRGIPIEASTFHLSKTDLSPEILQSVLEQAIESTEL
ncbi:MAG: response regulator [Verrucomicrobiota bacterium]